MAQFVKATIDVDGKSIKQFTSFALSQSIFDHHTFRLVCPTEAVDVSSGKIFNASQDLIGGTIKVQIEEFKGGGVMKFSGLVTQIEAVRHSGHAGDIVISGYSPTIILDNGPHCESWEKKAFKNIATEVLGNFPQNLLNPKISPAYGETLSYTVQYKETAWQFLSRLSATFGEWLYYDGQKLVIGPPKGTASKLSFGVNLPYFNMALQLRPFNMKMMAYDYMNHQVYKGNSAQAKSKAGLDTFGQLVYNKSEKFYGTAPTQWHNQFLTNQKQLDDFVQARGAMQSSNMVRFNGSSDQPEIQLGGTVNIQGRNAYHDSDQPMGDFTLISVNHHCDGQGNYTNDFIAIPASVKMPPVTTYAEPVAETQSALVTDNYDTKGLGRVRVKFHWMADGSKSPWLRVAGAHTGSNKGMYFTPEIGEEVIIGFEGDSPIKPFVMGAVYHEKAKSEFGNKDNDVKAIQTRSGNKVIMNDKEGSVFVEDKDKNSIKLDGEGNINVLSNKTIVLTCGDSKIEMKKDGTINITGKKITTTASEKAKMDSGQASFTADGQGNEAKMEGMKANISGSMEASLKGGAKTEVSASGNVAVKATLITLN